MSKSTKPAKKTGNKAPERAVSEAKAKSVIERLKTGKTSVMAAAREIGCYHATLRKALRAAIGDAAYTKLMDGKKGRGTATKAKPKAAAKKKPAATRKRTPAAAKPAPAEPAATPTEQTTTEGVTE